MLSDVGRTRVMKTRPAGLDHARATDDFVCIGSNNSSDAGPRPFSLAA